MNDCTLMNFICGFLLGFMLGICLCIMAFDDDYEELKQFREDKIVQQKLNEKGCK